MDRMNAYMEQCKLPSKLRREVREFLHQVGRKLRERALLHEVRAGGGRAAALSLSLLRGGGRVPSLFERGVARRGRGRRG